MEAIVSRPSSCLCLVSSSQSMDEAILVLGGFSWVGVRGQRELHQLEAATWK